MSDTHIDILLESLPHIPAWKAILLGDAMDRADEDDQPEELDRLMDMALDSPA